MLAGCSSVLLSPRHKLRAVKASVQKMSTRPFGLPNGFPFRPQNPVTHSSSSSSVVPQSSSWRSAIEVAEAGGGRHWERRRCLKRLYESTSSRANDRAKRTRTGDVAGSFEAFPPPKDVNFPPRDDSSSEVEEDPESFSKPNSCSWSSDFSSSPERNVGGGAEDGRRTVEQGLQLVSLLTSCADSISSGNYQAINFFLARLGEVTNPMGSPVHRLAAYFTEALVLRVAKLFPHIFSVTPPRSLLDPCEKDIAVAVRVLDCATPIPKFLHFNLNEMLLNAFKEEERVHIIDFDFKQGLQWPSLLQSLASRPNPPSRVRITGVGECRRDIQSTGDRLVRLAESMNLSLEFHTVVDRLEDVRLWMLHVRKEECVAVNCVLTMHKVLCDESGKAFMDLLGLIRSTNPAIVVMAEQEAKHNESIWGRRLTGSMKYYATMFDCMDCALPRDKQARVKAEELFAKEIRNIVACEGDERIERHENFDTWRKLMEGGGFASLAVGQRQMIQSSMILRMYSCESYGIEKQGEDDGLTLKWLDQPLYTVSAWTTSNAASSSSTPQPNLPTSNLPTSA